MSERVDRAVSAVRQHGGRARTFVAHRGFPWRAPTVPRGVEVPKPKGQVGADFDTAWARKPAARATRSLIVAGPLKGIVKALAHPEIVWSRKRSENTMMSSQIQMKNRKNHRNDRNTCPTWKSSASTITHTSVPLVGTLHATRRMPGIVRSGD